LRPCRYAGQAFDYIITVCNNANETCPVFPGAIKRLHWPFDDPAAVEGAAAFRRIRDQIHARIMLFLGGNESGAGWHPARRLVTAAVRHLGRLPIEDYTSL
jgi:hypothetical protein